MIPRQMPGANPKASPKAKNEFVLGVGVVQGYGMVWDCQKVVVCESPAECQFLEPQKVVVRERARKSCTPPIADLLRPLGIFECEKSICIFLECWLSFLLGL